MRNDDSGRVLPTLITLIVLSLLAMTLDLRSEGRGVTETIRSGVQTLMVPAQQAVDFVMNPVEEVLATLGEVGTARERLRVVEAELAEAEARLAEWEDQISELEWLQRLFHLVQEDLEPPDIAANVVGRSDDFDPSFFIDKGSRAGVVVGQPVLDPNGNVVGRVTAVSPSGALVLPLTADGGGITVRVGEDVGSAVPRVGSELMELRLFDARTQVQAGDRVVTSAQSTHFPAGLPVGEIVEDAEPQSGALTTTLQPFANIEGLRVVAVLAWPPTPLTGNEPDPVPTTTLPPDQTDDPDGTGDPDATTDPNATIPSDVTQPPEVPLPPDGTQPTDGTAPPDTGGGG